MVFLSEQDEKTYKKSLVEVQKFEKVSKLCDVVTEFGQIEVTQDHVRDIEGGLAHKLRTVSTSTEKSYIYLHQQMKTLATDMEGASYTI